MRRRDFSKSVLALGLGTPAPLAAEAADESEETIGEFYTEPAKKLAVRRADVLVAGAGTAGVVAALAAARQGA